MKTLEFKGMGWDECEGTNDVGNPRIRAQFFNTKGEEFFVEFIKNSKGCIFIDFSINIDLRKKKEEVLKELYKDFDKIKPYSDEAIEIRKEAKRIEKDMYEYNYKDLERNKDIWQVPYTVENIITIVNYYFDCDFTNIKVN